MKIFREIGRNFFLRFHIWIVIFFMIVQVMCAVMSSTASSDTNRDIFYAWEIANGREFPLIGPAINGMLHLGPLWFYILSPAVWLIPNAAVVTGFMALIGSLQFPMAKSLFTI